MMTILKRNAFPILGMLVLALIYLLTFPTTVQSGDTGELITNAFYLRVSHPPGYPLYHLLYHLPVKYFPFSSVFGRGALFTIAISLLWMGLLLKEHKGIFSVLLLLVTGTSLVFWRYAILPDVFCLHILFLVLVYLAFVNPEKLRSSWAILAISLGIAHHHTILFVFPLYVYSFLKGDRKKLLIYSILAGLLSFSLYFLLLVFHPENYYSWGFLRGPMDVIRHFLRSDYGTFQLSPRNEKSFSWGTFFIHHFLRDFWSFIILAGFFFWKSVKNLHLSKNVLILFCLVFYLSAFIFGGGISLDLSGQGVFERFLLQPILMLVFYFLIRAREFEFPKWILALLILNAGLNIGRNWHHNNYSSNTLVEDYAINTLNSLPEKSIFFAQGDTEGFATYYSREILGLRRDVFVLHPGGTNGWAGEKLAALHPEIYQQRSKMDLENFDLDRYSIYSNKLITFLPKFTEVSFYGMIYRYQKSPLETPEAGHNCSLVDQYRWRTKPDLKSYEEFEYSYFLYDGQSNCAFDEALNALKKEDSQIALNLFLRAQALTPFSVRIMERTCYVYGLLGDSRKSGCESRLDELLSQESQQYYLYQF